MAEAMSPLEQLEAHASGLSEAAKKLSNYCRNVQRSGECAAGLPPLPFLLANAPSEVHMARRSILSNIKRLQLILYEPADFLQQVATQNQYLACLHWLGEFQVLACIPLGHSVPFEDVAELAGVPEPQLSRVVRMMATTGFLHEPEPGHVAHSSLSAPFVTRPSYLDAAMFLAETAAPAALKMAAATRHSGRSRQPQESAYNLAFNTPNTFASECARRPKVQRQWSAYLHYGMGDTEMNAMEVLRQFDWFGLGNSSVVKAGARGLPTVRALANLYPHLRFIVQTSEPGPHGPATPVQQQPACPRISIQQRAIGAPQNVANAGAYILGLPSPSPRLALQSIPGQIASELRAHVAVARTTGCPTLVLSPRLLPKPGTVDPDVEALARLRDLSLYQLANEREMDMAELMDVVNSIADSTGRLGVVRRLTARTTSSVALEVRYHAYGNCHEL